MDTQVTLSFAVTILHPPITEAQLRQIVRALGWQSTSGKPCRSHPATYPWTRISALHQAILPFLQENGYALRGGVCPEQDT